MTDEDLVYKIEAAERGWRRVQVAELLDELDIQGEPRRSMLADPERAEPALTKAKRKGGVRNRAAYAIDAFRNAGLRRARRQAVEADEPAFEPPTLSTIELVWAIEGAFPATGETMLSLFASAIGAAGGFNAIKDSFRQRDRYDADGNLASREELSPAAPHLTDG